ncbi:GtrA family protein [Asanoa sp. WMMD1127]|uniref:GtrA family protein n=1 Tax=Asanoa sp. WMMD1127 TaxID=3016107 RepID=UPI00241697E7|nr:GtrA family protein [Asanoa sp. WMMD1127]MDG4822845.1 GtrA family protein [Asanoa sp. WMMD1127]
MSATVADDESSSSAAPQGVVARLRDRFGHLVKELGKFGTVGGIAFLVDLLIFNLLISGAGTPPLIAKTISTVIAASLAFVGNRFWTWRHRASNGLRREYVLYFFFNAVGLGIGLACLGISHYILGNFWPSVFQTALADNISGQFIGTAVGTLFRFWSYRRFVFIDAAAAPPTPSASVPVTKGD